MPDTTARLGLPVIAPDAVLLSNDGGRHQLKINKAGNSDTASLLYQSDWTGHAEMGLAGNNNFHLKVSSDGSTWSEALVVDAMSGHLSGAAVQANAIDTTSGRLARADYVYGPGNLLGTVSETSGTPTGAMAERGSNANGEYVRFADGTQICTTFDFTELPEGAELPAEAIDSDWFAGPVRREGGRLFLTLLLPHSAMAPEEMRFPQPLSISADGVISIPAYRQPQEASDVQD